KIDLQNEDGVTALMWAALHDHADTVKTLLAKGADAKIKSKTGKTAVEMAKDPAIAELLQATAK
ncbi:MAG: ankyrin repeat domain-containing protein, partial [Proteobacteria bacterium]|nr:ankyrin repeat domain-containing protein [Pseudomonadota bacterium]